MLAESFRDFLGSRTGEGFVAGPVGLMALRRSLFIAVLGALAAAVALAQGLAPEGLAAKGLAAARPEAVGLSSERLERLRRGIGAYVEEGKLPGAIVAVARRGRLAYFEPLGLMDVEAAIPMRGDAIFRIYSMTKPITGVAVMILYEEGRFRLTDPVSKVLPELADLRVYAGGLGASLRTEPAREMTIKHLLTHTSGLAYGDTEPGVPEMYGAADLWTAPSLEDFIARLAALPLIAQPGTEWHYSVGMDVLGRLVEVVSGQPFERFCARRIFEPLGMVDTAFHVPDEKLPRFAALYRVTEGGGLERAQDDSYRQPRPVPFGGHGLVSTAADYLRFAQMLAAGGELDGERILGRKTVELMMMDHLGPELGREPLGHFAPWLPGDPKGYGFGFTGSVVKDVAASAASGSAGTFAWGGAASTFFWVDRQEQLVGLLLTQLMPSAAYPLRAEMMALTYQAVID